MKKKGFTLIELLAVIVILAIIALIAIPLIGNVIEKAKIGALENSVNGLVESANMYYANQTIKGEQVAETTFDFAEGVQTSDSKLEYKGKVYNGKLILHANGETAICIDDKEHYAYKNKDTDEIVSGIGTCLYDGTTGDFSSNSPAEDLKKQIAAATATSDKVLEGDTIYTLSGLVAGTMANKAGATVSATTVNESEDGENALISIPTNGYYDTNSQISVPIETIKNEVEQLRYQLVHTFAQDTASKSDNPIQLSNLTHKEYIVLISAVAGPHGDSTLSKTSSALITSVTGGTYTEIGSSYRIINTNYASSVSRIYRVTLNEDITSLTINHNGNYSIVIAV